MSCSLLNKIIDSFFSILN